MNKKDEWRELIEAIGDLVAKIMGYRLCPRCRKVIEDPKQKFCNFCNFEMPQLEYKLIKGSECPKCHKEYTKGELFCGDCGEKLVEKTTP